MLFIILLLYYSCSFIHYDTFPHSWVPLQVWEWFGAPRGYRILYRRHGGEGAWQEHPLLEDVTASNLKVTFN